MYADPDRRFVEVFLDRYDSGAAAGVELHRVRIGGGRCGVVVLAHAGERVVLVRQWRPAVGRWAWELPRGFGESVPEEDALRELAEETGLQGGTPRLLARLDVDSGIQDGEVAVVEVPVPDPVDPPVPRDRDHEVANARWWTWAELREAVRSGEVRDAFTLAALGAAAAAGLA
jgi:ADP-ribose pyrophosphatase